ncbi:MAG: hypothetical protein HC819_16625 [Cyclobacteriaceae bacterium]|nr:hypothetical protein [Cyclobacteriaceae bacterium]
MDESPDKLPLEFQNELTKLKLSAERGAVFSDMANLSPEEEAKWLENLQLFEESIDKGIVKKVKDILGNPQLPKAEDLTDADLADELQKIIDLMHAHFISLDVLYDVPERVVYTFITDELMEQEMEVVKMPDMFTCFIYEDFHPNDMEDLKQYTEEFIDSLVRKEFDFLSGMVSKEVRYHEQWVPSQQYIDVITVVLEELELTIEALEIHEIIITDLKAEVVFWLSYEVDSGITLYQEQMAKLAFEHDLGYWYICEVTIPGLDI